jgi:hypothetical protein
MDGHRDPPLEVAIASPGSSAEPVRRTRSMSIAEADQTLERRSWDCLEVEMSHRAPGLSAGVVAGLVAMVIPLCWLSSSAARLVVAEK